MECIEARALKSSVLSQMAMKTHSQNDDVWCLTGINTVVGSDDFLVEDLLNLDFPEIDLQDASFDNHDNSSEKFNSNDSSMFLCTDDIDSLSSGELNLPVEDMENLEWLSQFVDDSSSELSLLLPAGSFSAKTRGATASRVEPVRRTVQKNRVPYLPVTVPRKQRSQRSRLHRQLWSLESPPFSTTEASSASSHGSSTLSPFVFLNPVYDSDWLFSVEKPAVKKLKRKQETDSGLISNRKCTHCQVQKTPQWRTGPLGPKTLCNACGVRFKSGRLFPEYRPACSPTFSLETHSNSHRKVLEMRRKKEVVGVVEPSLSRAVPTF